MDRRKQEIGIRIALGAPRIHVFRLVSSRIVAVLGSGIAVGLAGASLGSRALERFLYGVTPLEFTAFTAATLVIGPAAGVACPVPTRRATRIEPLTAIRSE